MLLFLALFTLTQIFDLESRTWRDGTNLPFNLGLGRVLQDGGTFLILGGFSQGVSIDTIIEFSPIDETWIVRNETLSSPKHYFYMIDVNSSPFC